MYRVADRLILRSLELAVEYIAFSYITILNTHVQNPGDTLPWVNISQEHFAYGAMCTSCTLALDDVDDGERCILLGTWHKYANVECTSPHVRFGTCEVSFFVEV